LPITEWLATVFCELKPLWRIPISNSSEAPTPARRDRSVSARRKARQGKADRERRIVNLLNVGVSVAEIAAREGVSLKRMRNLAREILAARMPQPPAEFLALR
jgi:DNA-binding CsgD family transcriptional regulator